ncbi:uncharacterized protein N7483_002045 [Penicillium malachiteum]|uniref:uncharacterized protein n=1 Tax=Penicillium malachiteum TaxID=1324776 RepID=UPI002548C3FD|nr:uncharacterized protein N7483_002045 [Penicillium malachiteum]KAJ5736920.1 hypothetical protein N7483_002045 [Penicillium malachiteum]
MSNPVIHHHSEGPQTNFNRGPLWLHQSPYWPPGSGWPTPPRGTRSLMDTAIRIATKDQSLLTPDLFKNIPWHIAEEIWNHLAQFNKQTLFMWRVMAINYEEFRKETPSYIFTADNIALPIAQYYDLLDTKQCQWRAMLSVSSDLTGNPELVALARMTNLVALEINQHMSPRPIGRPSRPSQMQRAENAPRDGISDSVVLSWLEIVESQNTLQHLRVLRLNSQKLVNWRTFHHLSRLPELQIIILYDCDLITRSLQQDKGGPVYHGDWYCMTLTKAMSLNRDACKVWSPLLEIYKSSFDANFFHNTGHRVATPSTLDRDLPMMEFQLPTVHPAGEDRQARRAQANRWNCPSEMWDKIVILQKISLKPQAGLKRRGLDVPQSRAVKPRVMKDRGGPDLSTMLGEFA